MSVTYEAVSRTTNRLEYREEWMLLLSELALSVVSLGYVSLSVILLDFKLRLCFSLLSCSNFSLSGVSSFSLYSVNLLRTCVSSELVEL